LTRGSPILKGTRPPEKAEIIKKKIKKRDKKKAKSRKAKKKTKPNN